MPQQGSLPSLRVIHLVERRSVLGVGGVLEQVAAEQAESGHSVRVVVVHDRSGPAITAGTALGARWGRDPVARRRLRRLLAGEQPDIVHAWDPSSLAAAATASSNNSGTVLMATLADPPPARLANAAREAADFVVSDRGVSNTLERFGVEPARIAVADRFALPTDSAADPAAFRQEWQIEADAPIVAAASELTREANLADTIWGFELLRLLHPKAVLVIAGEGPDRNRLERQMRLMSEPANARFVPGKCFADMLAASALFCDLGVADRWPVEALAAVSAGVPAIVTSRHRTRAALGDAALGHLMGHGDRATFGRVGDRVLTEWSPAAVDRSGLPLGASGVAQAVASLYERVLSGRPAPAESHRLQAI